jgi:hypothetical protein
VHHHFGYWYNNLQFLSSDYGLIVVRAKGKREALVQTGLRLEADLLKRLRGGGQSLSDEIRDRLNRTFKEDAIDPVTRELRDGLVHIAARLREDYKSEWHESSSAREAFLAAIVQRLQGYSYLAKKGPAEKLFEPDGSPELIGRIRENDDRHLHSLSYPLLNSLPANARPSRATLPRRASKEASDND